MARVDVNQGEILTAVVTHLRTDLSLNDRTCYEVVDPRQPPPHPMGTEDGWWLQIGIGPGQFDGGLFLGGGRNQLTEDFQVVVGIFSRIYLDESGHDTQALLKANRGVLRLKKLVLDSLTGEDLTISSNQFQRELWRPVYASQPALVGIGPDDQFNAGMEAAQMLLGFQTGFDWDLT